MQVSLGLSFLCVWTIADSASGAMENWVSVILVEHETRS